MKKLKEEIQKIILKLDSKIIREENLIIDEDNFDKDIYPFNRFEFVISKLLAAGHMSIEEYLDIRSRYYKRNKYLPLFEITAPRTFGERWAQYHLFEIAPELECASPDYDPNYSGEYDLWYNGIRIEVKASRAVLKRSGGRLVQKALDSNSKQKFEMNFQQMKPDCCDVFIWIAVWKDRIRYWVLSSEEVRTNKYYSSKQHRGNVGEGQLFLTNSNIEEFNKYEVKEEDMLFKIKEKGT